MTAPKWRRYVRFWRRDITADVDDEIAFHIEMRRRDLETLGLHPAAALAEAQRQFGDAPAIRDACVTIDERRQRRTTRAELMTDLWHDLTFAARGLRKTPAFALMSVLCVALGVCVTTTIFSAVNAILIRALPYPEPEQLVALYAQNAERGYHGTNISYPDFASWRDQNQTFVRMGIWTWSSHALAEGEAERVIGADVSANLFPLLGVQPILGRGFLPSEEQPGQDHVVLLSHGVWQRRFGADPKIAGRVITMDGRPFTVVGVMPQRFNFPEQGDVWVPFSVDVAKEGRSNRGYAGAIGRLKPGVTLEQAQADLATVSARLQHEFPDENYGWAAEAISLRQDYTGDLRRPLLVFLGAVGIVLLIACANVANLMLARGAARHREIAVRTALGAERGRLVRQLLTESMLIALVGGVAGAAMAFGGERLLEMAMPATIPFYIHLGIDKVALGFALFVTALTGALFGTLPALRATRVDVNSSLRDGARTGEGLARSRMRSALVVSEIALSVILMIGAMLLIRSYRALQATDLGFREKSVLTARISLSATRFRDASRRLAFFDQLTERLGALPSVATVGSAQGIPFSGWNVQSGVSVAGRAPARRGQEVVSHYQYVSPTYFDALGVPVLRGRGFTTADRDSAAPAVLVNELFAAKVFPGEDPIGKRVRTGDEKSRDPWATIVGVVRDFRHYRLPEPMGPAMYYPIGTYTPYSQTYAIHVRGGDPYALAPSVRAVVRQLDPTIPVYDMTTMEDVVGRSLWRQRLQGQVIGTFAALALLLAMVGIYGVISYTVTQRTRELGVRVALGAQGGHVLRLVLGQGARLAAAGIVVGVLGALALTQTLSKLLYGVQATDAMTFVAVPALLAVIAFVASYFPARRATRVDPLVAIRAE